MTPSRSPIRNLASAGALGVLLALSSVVLDPPHASAAPTCIDSDNPCDPDKLCTFKASLAEKVLIYQTLLRNSQVTRKSPGGEREGIHYDGTLYDASVKEAKASFPSASAAELAVKAGQIFNEKLRSYATEKLQIPTCKSGSLNRSLLPKDGYRGMYTDPNCRVWVNFEGGEYDPNGFGSSHTNCQEFYDRDRAHEVIHQRSCEAAKKAGKDLHAIDALIEDEIKAYAHSVRLTQAYVRLLSIQCSMQPDPVQQKARAKRIRDLLAPYLSKEK